MRRSLTLTVTAAVSMVLLAMLVPMAVLLRDYAQEDRISRAALEVQATESAVSAAGSDKGSVSGYLEAINDDGEDGDIVTSVVYPDGQTVGPPVTDTDLRRSATSRATGQARVDDVDGGSVILVPVSLGGSTAGPGDTPVVRIFVRTPGFEADLVRSWSILLALGAVLLLGALLLADRLGRSFVAPIGRLAAYAGRLGERRRPEPVPAEGPPEVRDLGVALHRLVDRVEVLLERERAGIADVSHRLRTPMTSLRLRVEGLADPAERERLGADLDELQATVDHVVREARRSEREGLVTVTDAVAVLVARARFWEPLAEDQGRPFTLEVDVADDEPHLVPVAPEDLEAVIDVLLDNVFTHTDERAAVRVRLEPAPEGRPAGGVRLIVEDAGPGLPVGHEVGRGASGAGSTGLGLAIVEATAVESGGLLGWGTSELGGAEVVVDLGPA